MTHPDDRTQPYTPGQPSAYTPTPAYPVSPPPPPYGPPPTGWPAPAGPPPRPVSKRLAFWTSGQGIVCIFVIFGAVVFLIGGIVTRLDGPASRNFETTVTTCQGNSTGSLATADVGFTITNTSKSTRSATVHIEYRDADGSRLDTDTSTVRNLHAGETARQTETTILDGVPTGAIRCAITGVS